MLHAAAVSIAKGITTATLQQESKQINAFRNKICAENEMVLAMWHATIDAYTKIRCQILHQYTHAPATLCRFNGIADLLLHMGVGAGKSATVHLAQKREKLNISYRQLFHYAKCNGNNSFI